jgi:hypothetical protein
MATIYRLPIRLLISRQRAEKVLAPHHEKLRSCVQQGWNRYLGRHMSDLPKVSRRGRANLVNELVIDEVRKAFDGFRIVETNGRFLLCIEPLVIRFKKLGPGLRTANYPTQQALAFDRQQRIPGIPSATRITVGYGINRLGTELDEIAVVCARGAKTIWSYSLLDNAAVLPLVAPSVPRQATARRRVRAKPDAKRAIKETDSK